MQRHTAPALFATSASAARFGLSAMAALVALGATQIARWIALALDPLG